MRKDVEAQVPNYPTLPSKLLCLLHSVTLHVNLAPTSEVVIVGFCGIELIAESPFFVL